MSVNKELNGEQLEKVTGGLDDGQHSITFTICFYDANGKRDEQDVVITYTGIKSSVREESECKKWCIDNGYEYISHKEKKAPSGQIVA